MSAARPPFTLHQVSVERIELITPHLKRITIDGGCLPDFRFGLPAQWLKVFVPTADDRAFSGRAYTVRRFDPLSRKLDLDFVLHGDNGPVSAWAGRAQVGDMFQISRAHPRSGFPVHASTAHYLLIGDETALPATGGILEALPSHARADIFVEVADADERQTFQTAAAVNVRWLHRRTSEGALSGSLAKAAKTMGRPGENTSIWVAAESSVVKSIREHALSTWSVDRKHLHAAGYWKRGQADHRDEDPDA
jgi:NADPH-dependent ferric siderophore reductase